MKPRTFVRLMLVMAPITALLLVYVLRIVEPNDRVIPGLLLFILGYAFNEAVWLVRMERLLNEAKDRK